VAPLLTEPYQSDYPGVGIKLVSLCADDLIRQLDNFELDLGLTYLEDPGLKGFRKLPLYRERHVLLARSPDPRLFKGDLGWADIAKLPLCLLTPNMQNRRLIDAAFREAGVTPNIMLETDSVFALYAYVRSAGLYSVVPHSLLSLFESYFEDRPIRDEYLIVQGGQLAGVGAHSYSKGNATGGSEEAAQFKKD